MMNRWIFAGLMALAVSAPAGAQVIEIDSSGTARTYDGPTLFTDEAATSLEPEPTETPATAEPRTLLAQAARLQGIDPSLLEAVAWQESRNQMSAVSPKGARGVMQLMPGTAAQLGVKVDDVADNIRGGALYLRQQMDRFGSVPLALAAYNAGPGAVLRYRGIPPYRETRDYVAKIMARWRPAAQVIQAIPTTIIEVPGR
jgi:soluble lytic murein transglycosylase-like protein